MFGTALLRAPDPTICRIMLCIGMSLTRLFAFSRRGESSLHVFQTGVVVSLAFSPDDRLLACGEREGELRLFDLTSGKQLWKINSERCPWRNAPINSVTFAPDGTSIAVAAGEQFQAEARFGAVAVVDTESGGVRHSISNRDRVLKGVWWCKAVEYIHDGSELAVLAIRPVADHSYFLSILNNRLDERLRLFAIKSDPTFPNLYVSPGGRFGLLRGSGIWDLGSKGERHADAFWMVEKSTEPVSGENIREYIPFKNGIGFANDNTVVQGFANDSVVHYGPGVVSAMEISSGTYVWRCPKPFQRYKAPKLGGPWNDTLVTYCRSSNRICWTSERNSYSVWSLPDATLLGELFTPSNDRQKPVFSPSGRLVAARTGRVNVTVWRL